jgi:uncharacterized membrane protein YccC
MKTDLPPSHDRRDPKLIAGLIALVLANTLHFLLPRLGFAAPDGFDFIQGTLIGIAIALLLWSVITTTRQRTLCD